MRQIRPGNLLFLFFLLVTLLLYFLPEGNRQGITVRPLVAVSQLSALLGTLLFSFSFILSVKSTFLEKLFGGLDKVYKAHRLSGCFAFIFLLNHPLLLMINSLPDKNYALDYLLPGSNWAYNFGIFSLWGMILLISLTLYLNLSYEFWKKTHVFLGISLLFAFLHISLTKNAVFTFLPLKFWILTWVSAASVSYLYMRLGFKYFGGKGYLYEVKEVIRKPDVIEILLSPIKKGIVFQPGQFAYYLPERAKESHPFSFSSSPYDPYLRFCAKIVGDFTLNLRETKTGDKVRILGPYGCFSEKFFTDQDAICIGGGIGITPYLSMVKAEVQKPRQRQVSLFYVASNQDEAYYHEELATLTSSSKNLKYHLHLSKEMGRLTAEKVSKIISNLRQKTIFLCGPSPMTETLRKQFAILGVKPYNIISEDFSLK